ncbi:MAG: hypothetical protein AAF824_07960 [Bacteroidota bacterium]
MKYKLTFEKAALRLVHVHITYSVQASHTTWYLPKWRPGRYELQAYHRNIDEVSAATAEGHALPMHRISTHSWQLEAEVGQEVHIHYLYYADNKDAGGSFVDPEMVYINGINLFLYTDHSLIQPCELRLDIPSEWLLAGIPTHIQKDKYLYFEDFHTLVDSPFFAAKEMIHHLFEIGKCYYHLWFLGEGAPNLVRMENDFTAFIKTHLNLFESIPTQEFHFLTLLRSDSFRHGVEHSHSTVLSLGPGHLFMEESAYDSFLEICSHELFHVWNVKSIRPADMLPYRYHEENYSTLHYITEGITTYYGDLMLWKSKVYSLKKWVKLINESLQRHYLIGGKDAISLKTASFNSWVNGYSQEGIPNRRISFYTKGSLVAMLLDMDIRMRTEEQYSLDDVMYYLYEQYGCLKQGYTTAAILELLSEVTGESFQDFFEAYISGTAGLQTALQQMASYLGLRYKEVQPPNAAIRLMGVKSTYLPDGTAQVVQVIPHGRNAGVILEKNDILLSINNTKINRNLPALLSFYAGEKWTIHYFRAEKLKQICIDPQVLSAFSIPQFFIDIPRDKEQQDRLNSWRKSRSSSFPLS